MKTLPANFSIVHSSNSSTSWIFNTTDGYDDPVVIFLNAITSETAVKYATTAVCTILFITLALPMIVGTLFLTINYAGAGVIYLLHRLKYKLKHGKPGIDEDAARQAIWAWWYWVSKIWFGFEMVGLDAVPPDEPVMFIVVHGITPAAIGSGLAIISKYRQHYPYGVVDKHHVNHPMLKDFFTLFGLDAWTREECVKILQDGNDLAIMPGGVLEMKYSDSNYNIVWGNRKGFASVAKDAKVAIVPMVCLNLNESFWTPFIFQKFTRSRFAPKRFAVAVGGLPVKLTAILGPPIPFDESKTVDDIFDETLSAMRQLLAANQRIPGNKFYALLDRFRTIKPKIKITNNTPTNVATIQV